MNIFVVVIVVMLLMFKVGFVGVKSVIVLDVLDFGCWLLFNVVCL